MTNNQPKYYIIFGKDPIVLVFEHSRNYDNFETDAIGLGNNYYIDRDVSTNITKDINKLIEDHCPYVAPVPNFFELIVCKEINIQADKNILIVDPDRLSNDDWTYKPSIEYEEGEQIPFRRMVKI